MNYNQNQVFNNATDVNTHSIDNLQNTYQNQFTPQADSAFATPIQGVPTQLPPVMSSPTNNQTFMFDPNLSFQPQFFSGMTTIYPQMDYTQMQTLPAQAVFTLPPQQFAPIGLFAGATPPPMVPLMFTTPSPAMTPAPPFQPVEVPANMRAFEAVHGQVFPVMKGEESCAASNASSESGTTFSTQKTGISEIVQELEVRSQLAREVSAYTPEEKRVSQKLPPPGFSNTKPKNRPQPAKREPKQPQTVNYARAASKRLSSTFKPTVRTSSTPVRVEKTSRQAKRGIPPQRAQVREQRKPITQPRRVKRKYGFRSKQNMIDKVFEALCEKYENLGILASKDEVLRGEDTIRLHVKKYKALKRIQEALEAVEREESVVISKVSIPLSMKNQFQKKGFLVYTRVQDVSMVDEAKRIFQQFEEFKKCEVARQSSESNNANIEQPVTIVEESETSVDNLNNFVEPGAHTIKSNDIQKEGHIEEEEIYGEADDLCGSVDPLCFDKVATGSPTISPVDDLFGEKDGCLGLDLTCPAFTPRISLGG